MTDTAFDRVLDKLTDNGANIRTAGDGRASAQCPAHDDDSPSLSVTRIEGSVLLHCFGGCDVEDVLDKLGMDKRELYDDARGASYRYADQTGTITRTVLRRYDSNGKKTFPQPGAKGAPILFRLPQVVEAVAAGKVVHLVEGEKDVLALESIGAIATTAPMGAGSFHLVDASPLRGAKVVAVVDKDERGLKWAGQVRDKLDGLALSLTFVQAAEGKDAADHIASGHGVDDLVPLEIEDDPERNFKSEVKQELRHLKVRQAAQEALRAENEPPAPPFDAGTLAEILARPPDPAMRVDGLIPWDASTLIVAARKTGKTTLELNLTRSLLEGEDFLGKFAVRPIDGIVGILNYEVSAGMLGRWADEAGIDRDRLYIVTLRGRRNPFKHPQDRALLAEDLAGRGVESLIVDPFGRAYTGKSQNDPGEVGAWLVDLDLFARSEVGAKDVILTAHAGWFGERTRGSSALEDWADSILTMTRDAEDDSIRFLKAMGRDVDVDEDRLDFKPANRTLTMSGTGSRKKGKDDRKLADLAVLTVRAAHQHPGIGTAEMVKVIRGMDDAPTFHDRDVSKAAKRAAELGHLRLVGGGPGRKTSHFTTPLSEGEK